MSTTTVIAAGVDTSSEFAALFEESLSRQDMRSGEVISAEVVRLDHNFVIVNAGLKSEAFIPVEEFKNDNGEVEVNVGDFISVAIESLENGFGDTILSRDKAKRLASWLSLEKAMESGEIVTGTVNGKVKGGLTVLTNGIRAFLPGSLVDTRPVKDTTPFEGKTLEFKVIKLDRKRNNVVLSRRAVIEASMGEERAKLMETLKEGTVVTGIVKNITDYGAFVDLGGIDGLLHITDLAWRRVRHPSEVLSVGQEITAKVLKYDQEKNRVSLGVKQLGDDPWTGLSRRYPQGTRLFGKVTNLTDYGAFVEVEQGIEGLVHVSEMDWTNKNVAPEQGCPAGRRSRSHGSGNRRRASSYLPGHEAVQAEPVGRLRHEPQEGRQGQGFDQVDHRLWRVHRPAGQHRRPGAPVRPVLDRSWRRSRAQVQEGRRAGSRCAGHRRGTRARLPGREATGRRPVQQLRCPERQGCDRDRYRQVG
ncbi:putative RNA-binding protein with RPS1 domain [Herbaspirillum rubrisubalbicans]|nr:putative RNA-binding protein with RPS1 domain [Herbaspirillum rubrisubalbicans]